MIRKKKNYNRPKKLFDKSRIDYENKLVKKYGLKNKKEIWKTLEKINYYRRRAMALAKAPLEEQEVLFNKLRDIGLNTNTSADVLALQIEDLLKRRLSSIVADKKIATTIKEARQMIAHKRILIDGKVVNTPGYIVKVSEEKLISLKKIKKKAEPVAEEKKIEKTEDIKEEVKGEKKNG